MKTFRYAGVSRRSGEMKARFANDALRVKILAKNGHNDIDIIELKDPMTKEAAAEFLLSIDFDNGNSEVRAALEAAAARGVPTAAKSKDAPKKETKKPKKPKATLENIRARAEPAVQLEDLEAAPF
jgi:hypothetical protein